jgi:hypothetical protein
MSSHSAQSASTARLGDVRRRDRQTGHGRRQSHSRHAGVWQPGDLQRPPKVRLCADGVAALLETVRIIANPSAGYDHMDGAAAHARGVIVTNEPDVLTDCTADLAFLLILAACRRAGEYHDIIWAGLRKPHGMPDNLGKRPSGQTLGIVGMGRNRRI